jgi:hypothetical protein
VVGSCEHGNKHSGYINSAVAERLLGFREGLGSMKLVGVEC